VEENKATIMRVFPPAIPKSLQKRSAHQRRGASDGVKVNI